MRYEVLDGEVDDRRVFWFEKISGYRFLGRICGVAARKIASWVKNSSLKVTSCEAKTSNIVLFYKIVHIPEQAGLSGK